MHVYSSSENRTPALAMIAVCAVLIAIFVNAGFQKLGIGPAWLFSPPTLAASFGLVYRIVDTAAWHWPLLRRLGLVQVPDLQGTYEGHLVSSYQQTTRPVRICIDQTWTKIVIRFDVFQPATSTSYSITVALGNGGHHHVRLTYTYRNQTRPGVADVDMNDHDGTAEVLIDIKTGEFAGRYSNFRGRQGTLTLNRVHSKRSDHG